MFTITWCAGGLPSLPIQVLIPTLANGTIQC